MHAFYATVKKNVNLYPADAESSEYIVECKRSKAAFLKFLLIKETIKKFVNIHIFA